MNKSVRIEGADGIDESAIGCGPSDGDYYPLEERMLFDGAAAAEAADDLQDSYGEDAGAEQIAAQQAQEQAVEALASATALMPEVHGNEIYFVDAGIANAEGLIAAIPDGAEVVMIDAGSDGVEQIASVLGGRNGIDALHILSHGEPGELQLGDASLNAASIADIYADELSVIGAALSETADILVYGCDFGKDDATLIALGDATGAEVAAPNDETGAIGLGGDWSPKVARDEVQLAALVPGGVDAALAPPEVTVPAAAVGVSEDTSVAINGVSVSEADDEEDTVDDILNVSLDVSNGTITLSQTTDLTVSGDGSGAVTLTGVEADINDALAGMIYRPNSNYNGPDSLAIELDDGDTVVSKSVGIQVAAANDAPSLAPTNPSVAEGGDVTLVAAHFGLVDPDLDAALNTNPQLPIQLVFQIDPSNLPQAGLLQLNGSPMLAGSTFTLTDVLNGNLTYSHNNSDVAPGDTDHFVVTVNDGGGSGDIGPTQITIDLLPVNQAPTIGGSPSVFEGQGTEEAFGTPGVVTETADIGASLSIGDRDDALSAAQVTITNIDNAGEGTLFWDADGDGQLGAGEALTGGETYAANELAAGRLRFAHNGAEVDAISPSFDIEVTDSGGGAGSGNALGSGPQTITISVGPNNDNPDLTTNSPLTVPVDTSVVIDGTSLQATDPDNVTGSIVYVVTEVPTKGELRINGEIIGVGGRFTQAEIDAGLIDYNSTSSALDGETDSFRFEVRDGTLRAYNDPGLEGADRNPDGSVTEHTFTINLAGNLTNGRDPGDPAPGRSGAVAIANSTNLGLRVTEADGVAGGVDTVVITQSDLAFNIETVDASAGTLAISPEETVYRITTAPGNGTLLLNGTALGLYATFTQADINADKLSFVHDGSENHQDGFDFSVTGGTSVSFNDTFTLEAIPTNDAPSVATKDLPLIPEGATIRLTGAYIGLGDVDTNNEPNEGRGSSDPGGEAVKDDLMFRFTDLPDNGTLERFDGTGWVPVKSDDLLPATLLAASADGATSGLRYVHDGSEIHADSFSVQVRDDLASPGHFNVLSQTTAGPAAVGNLSGTGTVNVTLAGQNDAPISPENFSGQDTTITDKDRNSQTTANVLLNIAEGDTSVIDASYLTAVDTDNTDLQTLQYRLTQMPAHGFLSLNGSLIGVGSTFTQADINNGSLSYTHDGSENFADQFMFVVSDSVADHVYSPGGASGASTFNIIVDSARNDQPQIANAGASTINLFDNTFSHNFGTALIIADPDIDDGNVVGGAGETDFIQVTVALKDSSGGSVDLSTSGGITLGSTTGLTLVDADDDDGVLVFQGAFADVQAALTNLNVELQNTDQNDTFTLSLTVDDRLREASGALIGGANGDRTGTDNADGTLIDGINNTDTISVTFRASDDNDDPEVTAVPGDKTVDEDTVLSLAGYVIKDIDAFGDELTVELAVTNGHISVTGDATTSDPSTLTLTGTVAELNAELDQLTYIANQDFHSPDDVTNNSNDDTLTITLNDGGGNGSGGGGDVAGTVTNIAINPVNDAPTVTVPGTQILSGGASFTFSGATAPTVGDAADANNTPINDVQRLTVSVPALSGTLTAAAGTTLSDLDARGEILVLEGTLAELNAALDGLAFTPANPNADVTVPITVKIDDMANGGTALTNGIGGALTASDTFNVLISNFNDAPTVSPPGAPGAPVILSVNEDSSLTLSAGNGNHFTVSDSDAFGGDMVATVTVGHGVVTAASGSGAVLSGDGSDTLTITGTQIEINAALDGLVYTPDSDFHTDGVAGDTITVTINDQGNTGADGAKSGSQSVTIDVDPVNDRPIATGGPATVTIPGEDQTGTGTTLASLLSGNYADSTDDQRPAGGGDASTMPSYIAIVGSSGYDLAQGTWQVSDGSGGWIDVPTSGLDADNALVVDASRAIRFVPAAEFHGTPGSLDVRLADGDTTVSISESTGAGDLRTLSTEGGTGETGRWSLGSVTLETSVANENDRPSASDSTLAAIDEDNISSMGDTVGALFSSVFQDSTDDQTGIAGGADASTGLGGIAIIGSAADAVNEGRWQYSTDDGANWTDIPQRTNDDTSAALLPNDARLRFVPVADFNGTPGALGLRVTDAIQTVSAGTDISADVGDDPTRDTDIWSTPINLTTSVTARNDAPVLGSTGTTATVNESTAPNSGTAPEQLVTGASVSDLDIATTFGLSQFGAGSITISMDDGGQSFDQLTISDGALAGIASVSGGSNGNDLVVDLAPTATTAQVTAIIEALRYTSNSDTFAGARDITITLSDGNNDTSGGNDAGGPSPLTGSLSASVTIVEQNDPPDASDNTVTTIEDTAYVFSAAEFNYLQPGGETDLMDGVRIDTLPGMGTLELDGNAISQGDIIAQSDIVAGNLAYVPPADQNGADFESFTFSVRDDRGAFDTSSNTMTVNVLPANDAPSASPSQDFTTGEDDGTQTVNGFMQAVDAGGGVDENSQTVTFTVKGVTDGTIFTAAELFETLPAFTDPTNGDNTIQFTPSDILAEGETQTVTVTVAVTDSGGTDNGGTDTGADQTFTITLIGANDAPVAVVDSVVTAEDTPVSGNLLANDSDVDANGAALVVTQVLVDIDGDGTPDALPLGTATALTDGAGDAIGTLIVGSDGGFTFTPAPDYAGPVPQAAYTISDGAGGVAASTLDITITPVDDSVAITGPTGGALAGTTGSVAESDLPGGTTPDEDGETVSGSFTVSAVDGIASLSVAGTTLSAAQLAALSPTTPAVITTPLGTLALTGYDPATGAIDYAYTLSGDVDHSGGTVSDDIALVLTDGDGDTASGALSVAVLDDAPLAQDDTDEAINKAGNPSSVARGNVVTGVDTSAEPNTTDGVADALGADGAAPGGPVTGVASGTNAPTAGNVGGSVAGAYGTLMLNADGSYSYTPDFSAPVVSALGPGASLTDVFSYEITDGDGDTATATLSVRITYGDDDPVVHLISDSRDRSAFHDRPERVREPLIVDHIVDETANSAGSLNSITSLLSELNTGLGVMHPILNALNGLQELDGTSELSTTRGDVFSGIDADGPVLQAVQDVGFNSLVDQHDPFSQSFPAGAADIDTIMTRSGFLIRLVVLDGDEAPAFLAQVWSPTGEAAHVRNVVFETASGEIIDDGSAVLAAQAEGEILANIDLGTGHVIRINVCVGVEEGCDMRARVDEVETVTFSDQTERYAQFNDYETARLIQAIRAS